MAPFNYGEGVLARPMGVEEEATRPVSASTGPITLEGKQKVARNALRHGLAGQGMLLSHEDERLAADRLAGLTAEFDPRTPNESELVRKMAFSSVRAEIARGLQICRRRQVEESVESNWGEYEREDALELAAKLPKDPQRIALKLQQSFAGAQWMLEQWSLLAKKLELGEDWNDEQLSIALDLMGYPRTFRDLILFKIVDSDPATQRKLRLDFARAEITRLNLRMADDLSFRSGQLRHDMLNGFQPGNDRQLNLYRRYEREADRQYAWALRELKQGRKPDAESKPKPKAESKPEPEPTPELISPVTKQSPPLELVTDSPVVTSLTVAEEAYNRLVKKYGAAFNTKPERPVQPVATLPPAPSPLPIQGNRHERRARAAHDRRSGKEAERHKHSLI
jgi:hypothetical protein